jgi:hypothetical protein
MTKENKITYLPLCKFEKIDIYRQKSHLVKIPVYKVDLTPDSMEKTMICSQAKNTVLCLKAP